MNIKSIFIGIGLFTSGAGVGAFIANRYLENKWMKAAEAEIHDSMKEFYETHKNQEQKPIIVKAMMTEDDAEKIANEKATYGGIINNYVRNEELKANISLVPEEDGETEFPDEYVQVENYSDNPIPYVIPFDSFEEEFPHHDKITLTYFAGDDTLTADDEELDPSLYDAVGDDALTSFGEMSEDPDIVYIRNEALGMDFEIIKLEKSYKEAVLGIHDEPVSVPKRPAKRSKAKTEDI